eukprot:7386104-Prymnesium_polylepis.1
MSVCAVGTCIRSGSFGAVPRGPVRTHEPMVRARNAVFTQPVTSGHPTRGVHLSSVRSLQQG